MRVTKIAITTLVFLLTATSILAQDKPVISHDEQSKYVISAKAGIVSTTEGEVFVQHLTPFTVDAPEPLFSDDQLRMSDKVRTGANGRAEILLNPGCYLRLAENTEIIYLFDGFTRNKIKLLRGSAIIEATVIDGLIFVETPKTKFDIVWNGLYRFNVDADGKSEVAVRKGRVMVGDTEIKEGKRAVAEGKTAMVASFNKKETDLFDQWSKRRAETLIAANKQLSKSGGLMSSLRSSFLSNAWIFDPFFGSYTFLPYTSGHSSPYGGRYPVCSNPHWNRGSNGYVGGGWPGNGGGHSGSGGGGQSGSSGGSSGGNSGGSNWSPSFPGGGGGGSSSPAPPVHNTGSPGNTSTPSGNSRPARP